MIQIQPVSKFRKQAHSKLMKMRIKSKQVIKQQNYQMLPIQIIKQNKFMQDGQAYQERQFQDSRLTKFIHQQLLVLRNGQTLFGLTSIVLSLMKSFSFMIQINNYVLFLHSFISIFLVASVIYRQKKSLQLQQKQLIYIKKYDKYIKYIKNIWFQSLILLIHPNIFAKDVTLYITEPIYGQNLPFPLNNIFQIIMQIRIYLLFLNLVQSSIYSTTRASRICRIYNTKNYKYFGPKSVFNTYPLHSLLVLYLTLVIIYSQMLKLAEDGAKQFQSFQNNVWCIIITMGTLGYGDYFPTTYIGRIIAICAAISGIILASLLILTLSEYLAMNSKQLKSHVTLKRLQLRQLLQKYAQQTIVSTSSMINNNPQSIQKLKKKTQRVKLTLRRLKNTVDTQNLTEEINNLFQSLYGHMMQIYIQQRQYADRLQQLYKQDAQRIQQIGFTFAGEIQQIIKDR